MGLFEKIKIKKAQKRQRSEKEINVSKIVEDGVI